MSDFDLDQLLAGAVDEYRDQTLSQIKPAGTAVAHATATHRKRVHAVTMSVLAAALVIAPVSAYASMDHDHNGPPNVSASHSATPSTTPAPSVAPSSPTASSPAMAPAAAKPITEHDLANATLTFPTTGSWGKPCPRGRVTVVDGHYKGLGAISAPTDPFSGLIKMVQADLDHNGTSDAVAIFGCHVGDPPSQTALAFRRAANGSIETMGLVESISYAIDDVSATADGSVRLVVTNLAGSDGAAVAARTPQSRGYRWNGTRFVQTTGSTSFTVSTSGLTAQISDLTFGKANGGKRAGTMTVSVHNSGSKRVSNASIVYLFGSFTKTSPTCADPEYDFGDFAGQCQLQSIAAGGTATVTFHFTATDSELTYYRTNPRLVNDGNDLVQIDVGDQRLVKQPTFGNVVVK